MMSVSFKH